VQDFGICGSGPGVSGIHIRLDQDGLAALDKIHATGQLDRFADRLRHGFPSGDTDRNFRLSGMGNAYWGIAPNK
jgi:hypothetical protein